MICITLNVCHWRNQDDAYFAFFWTYQIYMVNKRKLYYFKLKLDSINTFVH